MGSSQVLVRRAAFHTLAAVIFLGARPFAQGAPQVSAQALPDPKTLMDKHNAAVGGRAVLDAHTSMKMTASMVVAAQGIEASIEIFRTKPNKYLQKIIIPQLGEIVTGFDGKVGWSTNPMAGAQLADGEALEAARTNADFFANFQDPAAYSKSETLELTDFEGRKCYKVKVTRGTRDGVEYFDAATGLLAGIFGSTPTPQGPVENTTIFVEYGDFGGLKLPKKIEQRTMAGNAAITFAGIEFDKVDPSVFDLPAAVKALVKP